jgi:flagellar basal-body rod modification protein FlgD
MASTTVPSSLSSSLPAGITTLASDKQKQADSKSTLGQADFLKLMTAQLQNQDPNAPMDNGQFLGQMAQFSTVSSMGEMANQFKALADQMASSRLLSSGSMIGRSVLAPGTYGSLPTTGSLDGVVRLDTPADGAALYVKDAAGQVVDTFELGPSGSGDYPFSWDGVIADGTKAPPGRYQIQVSVMRGGKADSAQALLYTPITSVGMNAGELTLNLQNGSKVALTQVTSIR